MVLDTLNHHFLSSLKSREVNDKINEKVVHKKKNTKNNKNNKLKV
jgi:hypothetical protein